MTDIINSPERVRRGVVIAPWQFSIFKQLCSNNARIDLDDLVNAYEEVFKANGLAPHSRVWVIHQLCRIKLRSGTPCVENGYIGYSSYNDTLRWFIKKRDFVLDSLHISNSILAKQSKINWRRSSLIFLTSAIDVAIVAFVVLSKLSLPILISVARVGAVIILTNMAYILISFIAPWIAIPDQFIYKCFPAEYSGYYHRLFGIKIMIASVVHSVAHICQVKTAIDMCVGGCFRDDIMIVRESENQIVISYEYFARQFPYITGFSLLCSFGIVAISMVLHHHGYLRYSTNQFLHKYLTLFGFVMTVIHGCTNLLGFNFSYVLTLPFLLLYLWSRRYEILGFHVRINSWNITDQTVRLYLKDDARFDSMLDSFENITIYVQYPKISKLEWHPFTLSRGYGQTDAVLTMKRIGYWTNSLANILLHSSNSYDHINIGHYTRSKFRFHRFYTSRYFFCSGIGITAFISSMVDMIRKPLSKPVQTTLIWSIDSIEIINEFNSQLIEIQSTIVNVDIQIYYSNRLKRSGSISRSSMIRFAYLQSIIHGASGVDILTGMRSVVCCMIQRANFANVLSSALVASNYNDSKSDIGVFICGSKSYASRVIDETTKYNSNVYGVKFRVWSESV